MVDAERVDAEEDVRLRRQQRAGLHRGEEMLSNATPNKLLPTLAPITVSSPLRTLAPMMVSSPLRTPAPITVNSPFRTLAPITVSSPLRTLATITVSSPLRTPATIMMPNSLLRTLATMMVSSPLAVGLKHQSGAVGLNDPHGPRRRLHYLDSARCVPIRPRPGADYVHAVQRMGVHWAGGERVAKEDGQSDGGRG